MESAGSSLGQISGDPSHMGELPNYTNIPTPEVTREVNGKVTDHLQNELSSGIADHEVLSNPATWE